MCNGNRTTPASSVIGVREAPDGIDRVFELKGDVGCCCSNIEGGSDDAVVEGMFLRMEDLPLDPFIFVDVFLCARAGAAPEDERERAAFDPLDDSSLLRAPSSIEACDVRSLVFAKELSFRWIGLRAFWLTSLDS